MTLPQVPEWKQYERSVRDQPRGLAGGAAALILFSTLFLSVTAPGGVRTACGQDSSVQADRDISQAKPGQQAADSTEVSRSTAGVADSQSPQAQTGQQDDGQAQKQQTNKSGAQSGEMKGEWVIAPIPINSPAIGAGLEWAVARVFPLNKEDRISPPSVVGIGGLFTSNGSRALALGGKLYLKEDKYRITSALGGATINADIYGIGKLAGDRGVFVPITAEGGGFLGEFLYGLRKGVYIGARGQYRNLTLSLDREKLDSPDIPFQPEQIADVIDELREQFLHQQTVSIGPRFEWDSRDNTFYPKRGFLMDFQADLFAQGLGSKWTYQYYKVAFNKYAKLGEHQVLAFRGMGCAAAGDHVPIYDLCLFGTMNDLRGYAAGRYQDRRMFATQAEYRLMFPAQGFLGRFGVVAFAGFGGVGSKFSDIGFSDLLPAGGGGFGSG